VVAVEGDGLQINGDSIAVFREPAVDQLPWHSVGIDLVLECTGSFSDRATAELHIQQGSKKVLFSQPAETNMDIVVVYGVNHNEVTGSETIVSAASCTTNCIIPVIKVLNDAFGIESGTTTTIHSVMNDQPVLDGYHDTDLRKTRAAMQSIIPIDTQLDKGISRMLPELAGRFTSQALRVPVQNVSCIDLTVVINQAVTVEQVNNVLRQASKDMSGIIGYNEAPLASCDFNQSEFSGIVDAGQTRVAGNNLVKILVWFDNEWAYANRLLDVAQCMLQK
jgi:glyceraldehyde-3-phosphate dehydrogenase type I